MHGTIENVPEPKALASYAKRIEAERRNFRRYVIREQERDLYHHDKFLISVGEKGEIEVREARGGAVPEEIKPTPKEQAAIIADCAGAGWPKSIPTTKGKLDELRARLRKQHNTEPTLFVFHDKGGEILFVQQRIRKDDGNKSDLPWSFWSDGKWRLMEPYGSLPLFGLDRLKDAPTVFIHEGAKGAECVQWMVDALSKSETLRTPEERKALDCCPWARDMANAAHLGWPGGAPNPHRVDWSPISTLSPHVRVILVCDHDPAGENAARDISRAVKRKMWTVRFGGEFPRKFDLADPFPEELFERRDGARVYRSSSPSLNDCMEPATWATKGKELRAEFVEEWMYTVVPSKFINQSNLARRYDDSQFNSAVAPFSDFPNVAAALKKFPSAKAETLLYHPGERVGRITFERAQVVNIFTPSPIAPGDADDTKPFFDFMGFLVPDENDRHQVKRWCATLIACPHIRMMWGLLMISQIQGIGKTTLAEQILVPLVGHHNCSFPDPQQATDSGFNSWLAFKRLAVIAEIYDGQTSKAYNRLKARLTDEKVDINEKHEKPYSVRNWIHIYASSNSIHALKLDDNDRRWFVPGLTETAHPKGGAFFADLRRWLEAGGRSNILAWAQRFVKEKPETMVQPSEHAPTSAAKQFAIEEGRSDGEKIIAALADDIAEHKGEIVLRLDKIRDWLAQVKAAKDTSKYGASGNVFLESAERIRGLLKARELKLPKKRFTAGREKFRVVANFDIADDAEWQALAPRLKTPSQVKAELEKGEPEQF